MRAEREFNLSLHLTEKGKERGEQSRQDEEDWKKEGGGILSQRWEFGGWCPVAFRSGERYPAELLRCVLYDLFFNVFGRVLPLGPRAARVNVTESARAHSYILS